MSSKQLFVSDLDGTLLSDRSQLTSFTKKKLIDLLRDDRVAFTIASARSLTTIQELMRGIPFRLPIIQLNGACITHFSSSKNLMTIPIKSNYLFPLLKILKQLSLCFLVTGVRKNQSLCFIPQKRNQKLEEFYQERISQKDNRIKEVKMMEEAIDCEVLSMTVISRDHRRVNLAKIIKDELDQEVRIYRMGIDDQGWEWITIQSYSATKGNAIQLICQQYGFSLQQTTSFGDNINDLSMIQQTGMGIAVANAIEVLKDHAQETIGHCNENSVIKYIWRASLNPVDLKQVKYQ